ncbi:hypothetical protein R1sor_008696 [Riccia sorocarpa]|uniref:Uncharacterized protein n=1 Tax=Riccia sorocarpa TaxID=122646 RepID=A0ABD3HY60_9MARC
MEQDADPNDNPGHQDEADSGDEDGLEPIDMQHMVVHEHRTEHSGAWCIEIVKRAFVVPRPRRIDAEDVFESLTKFEEERKSGKRKTTTPRTGNNKKKSRLMEAVPEEPFDPMTNRAQQLLLLETRVPEDVREQNCYRRSRILNGGFDPTKYHDISYLDNKNNETQVFVPSFVECLNQARAQRIHLRRPKSTQGSTTKNDPFDQFKSIVSQTMGRKSYKEVIPLVCCSDETYAAFEQFVKRWKEGKIHDVHGTIGRSKDPRTGQDANSDFSQLSVNKFRPINGLSDEDLKLAWTVLEEGKLVYAFVSLGPEEYKPPLVENSDYRPHSCELRYKTWREEFTLDKGVGSEAVNLKNKAPRWDLVGIEPAEGSKPFVHPGSKRRFFCSRLLNNFSSDRRTVLDFFSRGVFAREALLSSRDVIYFASSQVEAEFMAKYGKLLHTQSERVKDWFATNKKKHGHVEVEAPPQAEQSGAVTVAALATTFVPDGSVMANAIERLGKCPQISYEAMVEEDESNPQGDQSNPQVFEGGGPLAVDEGRLEDNTTAAAEEANAQIPGNTSGETQAIKTQPKSKKKGRGRQKV